MILPPSSNRDYRGHPAAAGFLGLVGAGTLLPGLIHAFLPDGGAGTIAGIDLGPAGPVIIALFAWAGATQIVWGIALFVVALRYRALVPLFLCLKGFEIAHHALNGWVLHISPDGHHPPEHYAVLIALPLFAFFIALSLWRRDVAHQPEAGMV